MKVLLVDLVLVVVMFIGFFGLVGIYFEVNKFWYLDYVVVIVLGVVLLIYGIILGIEII